MRIWSRRAHTEIYTRQKSVLKLQDVYGVAVGGRRQLTLRVFIEALDNFLE
jgi:hypothetical protein